MLMTRRIGVWWSRKKKQYAKQILRIAVAQTAIALSQAMDSSEPNTQPLEQLVDSHVSTGAFGYPSALILCFAVFATLVQLLFARYVS